MAAFDFKRLLAVGAAAAVGLLFWNSWVVWPLKLVAVLFHEAGHALAAKAVGGEVLSIHIDRMQGGLCRFAFDPTFFNRVVTSSAGYLGSAVAGALLLFATLRLRSGRAVLWALCAGLVAVTVLWGFRSPFTLAVGLGMAAVLGASARWLPAGPSQLLAFFVAVFTSLYALFDLKDDLWDASRRGGTDAAQLATATGIPAVVWAALWTLVAVGLLGVALWRGARSRPPSTSRVPARPT